MALPLNFTDALDYFKVSLEFLKEYAWIYQYSNTAFLKLGVLEKFPNEFKEYFLSISNEELNEFPLLNIQNSVKNDHEKLQIFRTKLSRLIPTEAYKAPTPNSVMQSSKHLRKMNLKKQHEISQLARLITELCQHSQLLIDFGAGLGYLSEMLCAVSNNKFLILGLESQKERVHTAEKRCQEYLPEASNTIIYKQQFITEASLSFIATTAEELCISHNIKQPSMAIVGLHACADLSITAIRLFFDMGPTLARLIIMPCCYHKMELSTNGFFKNFPLSQAFRNVLANEPNLQTYLNRPFLRLACQQTLARWQNTSAEEHRLHGMEMFRRGVAEAIIDEEMEYIVKRKGLSHECKKKSFDEGFKVLRDMYELKSKATDESLDWNMQHAKNFEDLNAKYAEGYKLAEGLTCLQTAMQKLCENIVLYDRLCYMEEYASTHNLKVNMRYEKLLDEKLSPRCYVLIAEKL